MLHTVWNRARRIVAWLWRNLAVAALLVGCFAMASVIVERDSRQDADRDQRLEQAEQRAREADTRLKAERKARIANARAKQLSGRDSCQVNNARYAEIYGALRRTAIAQGYPPESYADLTRSLAPTNCVTKYPMPDAQGNVPRGTDDQTVEFTSCTDAKEVGVTPLYKGQPLYRTALDADGDGVACE